MLITNRQNGDDGERVDAFDVAIDAIDVRAIRKLTGLSQRDFAATFGLALGSVRNWEQGRSIPDASLQSYLAVIRFERKAVLRALEHARLTRRVKRVSPTSPS